MNVSGMISTNGETPVYFGQVASSANATLSNTAKALLYVYVAPLHGVNQATVVEHVPRMRLVGVAVPYDSVPEELMDNARDTALWVITTLCSGFNKAAIVNSMNV